MRHLSPRATRIVCRIAAVLLVLSAGAITISSASAAERPVADVKAYVGQGWG
jgi:hypothetical protein